VPLKRSLNLFDATLLIVGNVAGAGIFTVSGYVGGAVEDPRLFVGVWVIGGFLTLCGAFTYAEMSSMFPGSGGDYLFLKASYGPLAGFLLGWVCFWVLTPGSIAILSISMVKYVEGFVGLPRIISGKPAAMVLIAAFSMLNCRGVRLSGTTQNLWTLGTLVLLAILIGGGVVSGKGDWGHFLGGTTEALFRPKAFGPAMVAVVFAYSGWFVSAYIGDELKHPERNIPVSIFLGTAIITAFYTAVNVIYLYAMPMADMKGVINVGQEAAVRLLSLPAARAFSVAVVLAIAASLNATILVGARLSYAMASDELFPPSLRAVHPKWGTPYVGILAQAAIACLFVAAGSFESLLDSVVFVMVLSSIGTATAHMVLRRTKPFLERPYRTWGYPYIPLIFIGAYAWIAPEIAISSPWGSLSGLAIAASGIPFYLYVCRRKKRVEPEKGEGAGNIIGAETAGKYICKREENHERGSNRRQ